MEFRLEGHHLRRSSVSLAASPLLVFSDEPNPALVCAPGALIGFRASDSRRDSKTAYTSTNGHTGWHRRTCQLAVLDRPASSNSFESKQTAIPEHITAFRISTSKEILRHSGSSAIERAKTLRCQIRAVDGE